MLLWLEVGLEFTEGVVSRLVLFLEFVKGVTPAMGTLPPSGPPRAFDTELPLLSPGPACALHLLFTLSDLFIIALCTNPPRPFVGEVGRSLRSGDMRPCEGDIAIARPVEEASL